MQQMRLVDGTKPLAPRGPSNAHVLCRDHGAAARWKTLRRVKNTNSDAYQSGIDGQLLVRIDQQKYVTDVGLKMRDWEQTNKS